MPRPELYPVKKLVGFDQAMIDAIETWRAKQKPIPNVSEAIRRLVELGLGLGQSAKSGPKVLSTAKDSAKRAAELAGAVIDKGIPKATHPDERAVRKRKLLKGPSAFRDSRKDR